MPTALEMLHSLAEASGEYGSFTTTSAGSTTTLVCSRLANTNLVATEFASMYVLIEDGPCAGEIGHVKGGGLARSTGTLTVADAFSTVIASGTTFSLYRLLAPIGGDNVLPSYLGLVNGGVRRVPTERTIAVSGVTDQSYYTISQSSYPWFTDEDRIRWIEYPTTDADEMPRRMRAEEWEWDANGPTKRLYFRSAPFKTGETFGIKVMAPGSSLLVKNGSGLVTLTSTAVSSITVIAPGSYSATPTVTISGGGGSGATVTATLSGTGIASFSVTNGGTGYTSVPTVVITRHASDTGWSEQTSQTAGVATITDEALPDTDDVVTMGLALMFQALSRLQQPSAEIAEWLTKMRPAMRAAKNLQQEGFPEDRTADIVKLRPRRAMYRGMR